MKSNKNIFEPITWQQYSENRRRYGHVSTWALYNDEVLKLKKERGWIWFPIKERINYCKYWERI